MEGVEIVNGLSPLPFWFSNVADKAPSPSTPEVPLEPDVPLLPEVPLDPEEPLVPDEPLLPLDPLVPEVPDSPLHTISRHPSMSEVVPTFANITVLSSTITLPEEEVWIPL